MGGAIQVANSFIYEINQIDTNNQYLVCYTKISLANLDKTLFSNQFKFVLFESSPARLSSRFKTIKKLNETEKYFKPDLVFTLFGPSYWQPKTKHIMGFADGWVYNPNSIAFSKLNFINKIKRQILSKIKIYFLKKNITHYILETDDAKKKFSKYLDIELSKISVVSNTYNGVFNNVVREKNTVMNNNSFKLLTLSAFYPNKNLEIINDVIQFIPEELDVKFYLTLPDNIFNRKFIKSDKIINLGVQHIKDCPQLLYSCDVMFLPTLLETFSASYPEAMVMNKPILTSNYSFARSICGDAAEYFNPLSAEDIAKKIINLLGNSKRLNELADLGRKKVMSFPSSKDRAIKYLSIFDQILKK
tara:strand:- start:4331 stop:5410 length:1080 start_codon:yes stop_codon:yes gene_type:complete